MTTLIDLVASLNDTNLNHRVFRFLFPKNSPGTERATYTTVCVLRVLLYLEYPVQELHGPGERECLGRGAERKGAISGECFLFGP